MTEQSTFSLSELQQQANNGDAQAQFDLACHYSNGAEGEKNKELAMLWLQKAAE